jgi:hypothetical protein
MSATEKGIEAVEQSLHDAFKEIAQRVFDEFGISISAVHYTWRDEGTLTTVGYDLVIAKVELESVTNH